MESIPVHIPQGVKDVANHYSRATGIPCLILDVHNGSLVGQSLELDNLFQKLDGQWRERCFEHISITPI